VPDSAGLGTEQVTAVLQSPWEESIYLDADVRACADPGPVFDLLQGYDIGMATEFDAGCRSVTTRLICMTRRTLVISPNPIWEWSMCAARQPPSMPFYTCMAGSLAEIPWRHSLSFGSIWPLAKQLHQ